MASIGLKSQIWNNNLRSLLLLGLYPLLLLGLVWAVAVVLSSQAVPHFPSADPADAFAPANALLAAWWPTIITVIATWFTIAWFFNTALVRMVAHAHPVTRSAEPALYNMVENLCISRGLTMPRIEIMETPALNAFASGIRTSDYTVTVTRGLLDTLQQDELEAVIGHELTHILNRDVRLLMVCVVFTGMIGFAAQLVWSMMRGGAMASGVSGNRRRGSGGMVFLLVWLVLMLGYGASLLARLALSRAREFMADAGSVELTRNPDAMMRALLRISGRDRVPGMAADVAMMCIENAQPFFGLFATHPPIDARIKAISAITGTPIPDLAAPVSSGSGARNPWV